jgi:hypothetical protein
MSEAQCKSMHFHEGRYLRCEREQYHPDAHKSGDRCWKGEADEIRSRTGCKGGIMAEGAHCSERDETDQLWEILKQFDHTGRKESITECAAVAVEAYENLKHRLAATERTPSNHWTVRDNACGTWDIYCGDHKIAEDIALKETAEWVCAEFHVAIVAERRKTASYRDEWHRERDRRIKLGGKVDRIKELCDRYNDESRQAVDVISSIEAVVFNDAVKKHE